LGAAALGFTGRIHAVDASGCSGVPAPAELEHRLLELGFVEGATVEIRHQGLFRRDPIAIRVNGATIALRRREACAIHVRSIEARPPGARR
jgi:ferrous iron transport protein A